MSIIIRLTFVKKQPETDDIFTFYFSTPHTVKHIAGQHGLFVLPGLYRPHPFTLSSAPEEEYVTFSTHTGTGSRYKQRLMQLQTGDSMYMVGPLLKFTLAPTVSSYVFLAQGIGITPFRSMLVHAHTRKLPITTTLIHVDNKGHTFKDLTERYATHAYYPTTPDTFRALVHTQDAAQTFYLSGSPGFVRATKKLLRDRGVEKHHIRTDSFLGY